MTEQPHNLAFVFPGQGSQSVGMLNALAASYADVRHTFERASDALGLDLWSLVADGPDADLNRTENTQPAMLAAGFAVWQIWCRESTVRPAWAAGHSLGEYTALVCAEALSFEEGVKLVAARGRLMQEAVPSGTGAMAAILGLDNKTVVELCAQAAKGDVVSAVNFNAPGQVVIAGHAAAVDRAIAVAKEAGAKRAVLLPVSVPSHCSLMKPAAEKLGEALQSVAVSSPKITLIHNADVTAHSTQEAIRNALIEQLYQPVRWVDTIEYMHHQGVTRFIECGPGKVLTGLNKRIAKDADHVAIFDAESINKAMEQLND